MCTICTGKADAIASVASEEPESTTMISSGARVCRRAPVRSRPMWASSL